MNRKLDTEPYKGTRDFYPSEMRIQQYIFETMKKACESFGYEEYTASLLENSEIYKAKSGEEIVNEQTYTFTDRGDREVTLRPEMTPTIARMVAGKRRELSFPIRWYSIPNCFRYERPQKGRLREFWQLNVDLLGSKSLFADVEIISLCNQIMLAFGAQSNQFEIKINSRKVMNELFTDILKLDSDSIYKLSKLIDKKKKITGEEFNKQARELVTTNFEAFENYMNAKDVQDIVKIFKASDSASSEKSEGNPVVELVTVLETLKKMGAQSCVFDPTIMRGLDYYTGIVFEVFDTGSENTRSLFGGGRYDNLLDMFGVDPVPAVGFGMGDVTIQDFLETYNLIPKLSSEIDLVLCTLDEQVATSAFELADELRKSSNNNQLKVLVDFSDKKVGQKITSAQKAGAKFVICIGEEEIKTGSYTLKKLDDFTETKVTSKEIEILLS